MTSFSIGEQDTQDIQDSQDVLNGRESSNNTFEIYSEKQFDSTYHLEAWSPTADLLALVNYNNELHLYRPSWQRHWSVPIRHDAPTVDIMKSSAGSVMGSQGNLNPIFPQHKRMSPESKAISLTWRPDGKRIAVGLANGQVNIYDYSDGSLLHILAGSTMGSERSTIKLEIYCLKWTDIYLGCQSQTGLLGMQKSQKSILNSLPLFSPIPLSSSQQQMMLTRSMFTKNASQSGATSGGTKDTQSPGEKFKKLEEPDVESIDVMNVLFAGNSSGIFRLEMFGGFDTDSISLLEILKSYGISEFKTIDILKADIQLDLSEITIIATGSRNKPSSEDNTSMHQSLLQITLGSDLLNAYSQEIRYLGKKKPVVFSLLKYLSDGISVMQAEYRKLCQLTEDCLDSIQESLNENGVMTTPAYEFLQLLMTGIPSPSLDKYLQQELRRHGLRRWDNSAKSAYDNMQRIAFECLLPACERLLLHLTDVLGCSKWEERYKPLNLQESQMYCCIDTVGEFMGVLECLFHILKSGKEQFQAFENWLEHVLEILQPTIRESEDQEDDPIKNFPPVNYAKVSEFLKSGLLNKELEILFQVDENSDPQADSNINTAIENRVIPTYPVIYPFSEDLQSLIYEELERQKKRAKTGSSNNQFSGTAIAAALKSRGFVAPPNPPPPKSLFPTSKGQPTSMQQKSNIKPKQQKSPPMTFERRLGILTRRCRVIFEDPSKAVSSSIKVNNVLSILSSGQIKQKDNMISEISRNMKVATRYCYQDLAPWHYLAFYLPESKKISGPTLCVLRTRDKELTNNLSISRSQSPSITNLSIDEMTNLGIDKESPRSMLRSESKGGIPAPAITTRLGQKRRSSNPDVLNVDYTQRVHSGLPLRASLLLETPSLETLSLRSPRRPARQKSSDSHQSKGIDDLKEFEIAFFSLQEHISSGDDTEISGAISQKTILNATKKQQDSFVHVLDISFLDNDNLGMILETPTVLNASTSRQRELDLGSTNSEQFLISVPLQTSSRPYSPVSFPSIPQRGGVINLFDYVELNSGHLSSSKARGDRLGSPLSKPLSIYTIPISRSRCIINLQNPDSKMELDGRDRTVSFRIASNERENRRVVSVHCVHSKESTGLEDQGTSMVTVFEL